MLSEWFHNAVKMVNDDIMVALEGFTISVLAPNMNGFQDNCFFCDHLHRAGRLEPCIELIHNQQWDGRQPQAQIRGTSAGLKNLGVIFNVQPCFFVDYMASESRVESSTPIILFSHNIPTLQCNGLRLDQLKPIRHFCLIAIWANGSNCMGGPVAKWSKALL